MWRARQIRRMLCDNVHEGANWSARRAPNVRRVPTGQESAEGREGRRQIRRAPSRQKGAEGEPRALDGQEIGSGYIRYFRIVGESSPTKR